MVHHNANCSEVRCVCLIRASHCSYLCNTKQKASVSLIVWFGHSPHRWRFKSLNGLGTRTLDLGELLEFCCHFCTLRWGAPFRSNALTVLLGWAGLLDYAQIGWFCALVTCLLCFVNGIQQLVQGGSLVKRGSNQTAWVWREFAFVVCVISTVLDPLDALYLPDYHLCLILVTYTRTVNLSLHNIMNIPYHTHNERPISYT
jgi:hypothetical protein